MFLDDKSIFPLPYKSKESNSLLAFPMSAHPELVGAHRDH